MAVIEGGVSGSLMGVGSQSAAPGHVALYPVPPDVGGVYQYGGISGTIAAALAGNSEVFQFRYVTATSRIALIQRVVISAGANVAATAAALVGFRMCIARNWTAAGSGGTRVTFAGNANKLRTSYTSSEVNDVGISTTGALTAGTKTLDATDIAAIAFGIGTGALTVSAHFTILPPYTLFDVNEGNHPVVLANQEGFIVRIGANAFPATMTWNFGIYVCWFEVPSF
jgi:hypothetical protein